MRDTVLRSGQAERDFRWRGKDVSRVENLSDIVFALAFTLVVASSVPQTFDELTAMWRELVSVAACFALLTLIWRAHYVFFRRYDLEDGRTIWLNNVLLFLVLAFAYPLKFLSGFMVDLITFLTTGVPDVAAIERVLSLENARWLTVIYATGYTALFAIFASLYAHAHQLADELDLTAKERRLTWLAVEQSGVHGFVSVCVIALAMLLPVHWAAWSGAVYFLIGPFIALVNRKGHADAAALG